MSQKKVWQLSDVDVLIYLENTDYYSVSEFGCMMTEAGSVVSGAEVNLPTTDDNYIPALFSYCYLESATINGTQAIRNVQIPGRPRELSFGGAWKYTVSIEHLYFDKDDELRLDDVFSSNQNLRIAFRARNIDKRNDTLYHVLKQSKVSSFNINGSDDDTISVQVSIDAEDFYIL